MVPCGVCVRPFTNVALAASLRIFQCAQTCSQRSVLHIWTILSILIIWSICHIWRLLKDLVLQSFEPTSIINCVPGQSVQFCHFANLSKPIEHAFVFSMIFGGPGGTFGLFYTFGRFGTFFMDLCHFGPPETKAY